MKYFSGGNEVEMMRRVIKKLLKDRVNDIQVEVIRMMMKTEEGRKRRDTIKRIRRAGNIRIGISLGK